MKRLPVIVSMGGISPAGRSANFDCLRLITYDALTEQEKQQTIANFARLMNISPDLDTIKANTLIRKIPKEIFDIDAVPTLVKEEDGRWKEDTYKCPVSVAGAIPSGFDMDNLYKSVKHPRAVKMAIFAANEALSSLGMQYEELVQDISLDRVMVVASSSMGQMDDMSLQAVINAKRIGTRVSAKKLPFSYPQTIADFISSYVIGNIGASFGCVGACATFSYNLSVAVSAITSGTHDIAIVGSSDAPITPDLLEAFNVMDALANDKKIESYYESRGLPVDYTKSSLPFAKDNMGFVMGEGAQFFVVVPLEIAIQKGLDILCAVPEIFNNADGYKKSISAPGVGNYISFLKASKSLQGFLGNDMNKSFIMAHGTSTPQNRKTESMIFNKTAIALGLTNWATTSIKSYIGHSQAAAGADQLSFAIASNKCGIVPGMTYVSEVAEDVSRSNLDILTKHKVESTKGAVINSKGFGGNNSTFPVLFAEVVQPLIEKEFDKKQIENYNQKLQKTLKNKAAYLKASNDGEYNLRYFDDRVVGDDEVEVMAEKIIIRGKVLKV